MTVVAGQVSAVSGSLRDILGENLLGLWLHGSAVAAGLRPDSDLDLIAFVHRQLERGERAALVRRMLEVSAPYPPQGEARPIELGVVARADIVPWTYPPTCDLLYGEWLRREIERGALPARQLMPDLAIVLTAARAQGVALIGVPPGDVLEPIPEADLRAAMLDEVPNLLVSLPGDERNVLLTLARILATLRTGEIVPKDVAALAVLGERGLLSESDSALLATAREEYLGQTQQTWADHQREVRGLAQRLAELAYATLGRTEGLTAP